MGLVGGRAAIKAKQMFCTQCACRSRPHCLARLANSWSAGRVRVGACIRTCSSSHPDRFHRDRWPGLSIQNCSTATQHCFVPERPRCCCAPSLLPTDSTQPVVPGCCPANPPSPVLLPHTFSTATWPLLPCPSTCGTRTAHVCCMPACEPPAEANLRHIRVSDQ